VKIGYQRDLDGVCSALRHAIHDATIPPGQWLQIFDEKFGRDHKGAIGAADAAWIDSFGDRRFPVVNGPNNNGRGFGWENEPRGLYWRWLVQIF
jgi:hypothetical protein